MKDSRRNLLKFFALLTGSSLVPSQGKSQTGKIITTSGSNTLSNLSEIVNLYDFEKIAEANMSKMAYEYVASGAADEFTLRWNRQSLDGLKLNTSVLHDVSKINTRTTLFGQELAYPILIAPTAFHGIMHPEGELATVRGAGAAAAVYVVSSFTTTPLEEIKKAATHPLWFQLYVRDDREFTKDLVQKAEALGYQALCITVDTPLGGARNRQQRVNFKLPSNLNAPYMLGSINQKKPLTWKDMEWLRSITKIPVLLKGILNPLDAEQAVKIGASGIIVSNHGGRNLDTTPATIDALPFIAEKIQHRIPILMDGGIRRGTDVLKAIALGANAVLVGKPICFGLASAGAEGVTKVLDILKNELELAMALTGRASLAEVDSSLIWKH
jgi:4-hydroxymandelate oxidase